MDERYVLKCQRCSKSPCAFRQTNRIQGLVWTFTHTMFILLMQDMSCIFASNHDNQNTEERRNPHGVGRRLSKLARLWAPGPTRLFVALWSTCSFQTANLRTVRSTYFLKDQGNSANILTCYLVSSAGVRWQKWLAQRSHWSGRNVWS